MATSMNPADLYQDPSPDDLVSPNPPRQPQNAPAQRSSSGRHRRTMTYDMSAVPPAAPAVPRGPPISYPGVGQGDGTVKRSFSQRAKNRPFAAEAFADADDDPEERVMFRRRPEQDTPLAQPAPAIHRKPAPSEGLRVNTANLNGSTAATTAAATKPVRREIQSARDPPLDSVRISSRSRRTSDTVRHDEPVSAVSRSSAYQDGTQRRDWAPDRSPLQKLEVTLNDISKEEKRARVQEAEMLLRDAQAARGVVTSSRDRPAAVTVTDARRSSYKRERASEPGQPTSIEDAGLVRNLSTTQRQRLQHSTTVDSHKPDVRSLSGEGRPGFEYTVSSPLQPSPATQSRRSSGGRYRRPDQLPTDQPASSPRDGIENYRDEPLRSRQRRNITPVTAASAPAPVPAPVPAPAPPSYTEEAPTTSTRNQQPPSLVAVSARNDVGDLQRNASHKAALEKLIGVSAPVAVARTGSRKLQKAPPAATGKTQASTTPSRKPVPATDAVGAALVSGHAAGAEGTKPVPKAAAETLRPQTPPNRGPIGLGLQASPNHSSPQSVPERGVDVTRQRQRKSSVSFKEPIRSRPVDEWKEAGTARLMAADFSQESVPPGDRAKAWWEQSTPSSARRRSRSSKSAEYYAAEAPIDDKTAEFKPRLYLRCGPLLRYTGMKRYKDEKGSDREFWRGSVMIVTQDSHSSYDTPPVLRLFSQPKTLLPPPPPELQGEELRPEYVDPIAGLLKLSRTGRALYVRPVDHLEEGKDLSQIETDDGLFESSPSPLDVNGSTNATSAATNNRVLETDGERVGRYQQVLGARLYADPDRDVTFWRFNIEVELGATQQHIAYRINRGPAIGFWVPAGGESMNIMFHSCNGFSMAVNPDNLSGPDPLWRDVLNAHQTRPFHVMIGGGDQIYNDRVMLESHHFGEWTRMRNPSHKHHAPFTNEMKEELETFYLNRYSMWFSQGLFSMANSQIPMVNIWDDHDIIDGFGSYPNHLMDTPVFSGLGGVAFKYYMLFQHQSVPEETSTHEPSWLLGHQPGPYIKHQSRSVFMHMGRHVAFLGLDCRTERMRNEVLSVDTVELVLERCRKELVEGETKHLIICLGVPIAYPRLVWLENVLTSRLMDPVKALGRAGVLKGGFLNKFDGGVEILDDLDDHWTSTNHKQERNDFVKDLQDLAAEKSCRITILSGDVHLAAVGQFHSNPKLKIPKDRDHRYMPNVISSAIVNTPPSDMLADILNKRNKTHHLDKYTDENMIPMFTHDVDHKKRNNKHMLPRRNWCSIREYVPGSTPPASLIDFPESSEIGDDPEEETPEARPRRFSFSREDLNPRGLIRRLSSRKAPPSAFPQTPYQQGRSASHDGTQQRSAPFSQDGTHPGSRQSSGDFQNAPGRRASSFDHTSSGVAIRPGILRRPTNLSEKAARKGNIPAVDADGNEFDVNDHVNLEGGLDIVLNVEIDAKNPSGVTMPYRLLIPALWYDGSSDREKLDEASAPKKPGVLSRFSLRGRRNVNAAGQQDDPNWDQEMSDESYSEGEEVPKAAPPRRRFSLFGNRRKKEEYSSESESGDENEQLHQQHQPVAHHEPAHGHPYSTPLATGSTAPRNQRPPPQEHPIATNIPGPVSHDKLYDTDDRPPQGHTVAASHPSVRRSLTITSRSESLGAAQARNVASAPRNVSDTYVQTQNQPSTYTATTRSASSSTAMYDHNTGSFTGSGMGSTHARFNAPPNSYAPSTAQAQSAVESTMPQRRLSKQERILGINAQDPPLQIPPQQLRGNGLIGKNYDDVSHQGGAMMPGAGRSPYGQGSHFSRGSSRPQGYSGIEAWKEPKPRRGWSLRGVRDLLGSGRRDVNEDDYD